MLRFALVLVVGMFLVGLLGCDEVNNYYACAEGVSDGGDCMGRFDDDGGGRSIFTEDSGLSGSDTIALGTTVTLLELRTRDHNPRVLSVSLGNQLGQMSIIGLLPDDDLEVVALLDIGIGDMVYRAEVDFLDGVQFSVLANSLKISAAFRNTVYPGTVFPNQPQVKVGAAVSVGVIAHGKAPQRTIGWRDNGHPFVPMASKTFVVPNFAKSFHVMGQTELVGVFPPLPLPAAPDLLLTIMNNTGTPQTINRIVALPSQEVVLPNSATSVMVSNTSLGNMRALYLVFDLAL